MATIDGAPVFIPAELILEIHDPARYISNDSV